MSQFEPYNGPVLSEAPVAEAPTLVPYTGEVLAEPPTGNVDAQTNAALGTPATQAEPVTDSPPLDPVARPSPELKDQGPSLSMYDNIPPGPNAMKQALELYNWYKSQPEAKTNFLGITTYKGKILPLPSPNIFNRGVSVSPSEVIAGGALNAGKNIVETVGALGDVIDSTVGGVQLWDKDGKFDPRFYSGEESRARQKAGQSASQSINESVPSVEAGTSLSKQIGLGASEMVTGAAVGTQATRQALSNVQKLPDVMTKLVKFLGFETGIASGIDKNSSTIAYGENALLKGLHEDIPLLAGLKVTEDNTYAEAVLKNRVNLLVDAAMSAKPIELGVRGLVKGIGFVYDVGIRPVSDLFRENVQQEKVVRPILEKMTKVGREKDEAYYDAKTRIVDMIENNGNVFIRSEDETLRTLTESADKIPALEKALKEGNKEEVLRIVEQLRGGSNVADDPLASIGSLLEKKDWKGAEAALSQVRGVSIPLDTASALERALKDQNTDAARELVAQARAYRSAAINQGGGDPGLVNSMGAGPRTLEDVTKTVETARGGSDAIEQAKQGLVETGNRQVRQADELVGELDLRLAEAESTVNTLIKEDPTFGAKLDQLSNATGINIYLGRDQAGDQIVRNVRNAFEVMDAEKNALYSAVQGGSINPKGLLDTLNQLRPQQLDAAKGALPANSQFGELLDAASLKTVQSTDAAGNVVSRLETPDEQLARFTEWAQSAKLDFGKLYREIRPSVSKTADNLFNGSTPEAMGAAETLRNFVRYIDGPAIDDVIAAGNPQVAEAATRAKEYYTKQYAPFWRDQGVLSDIADLHKQTVGRSGGETGQLISEPAFLDQARNSITGTLNDANREYVSQRIVPLLSRPEAGNSPQLITDFIMGDTLGDILGGLKTGKALTDLDTGAIIQKLSSAGEIITRNFPDQAARVSTLIDNIRNARGNVDSIRVQLEEAQQLAAQARDTVYNKELKAFFEREGLPTQNGYAAFESILSSKNSGNTIDNLLARAEQSGNPLIRDGMQAAYMRYIRNKFLGAGEEMGGNRPLKLSMISSEGQGLTNAFEYGDKIFSNTPEIMSVFRAIADVAGDVTRSKNAKTVAADSPTAARQEASKALNSTITTLVGTLSRVGARARNLGNNLINRISPDEAAAELFAAVMKDTNTFVPIARRVIAKDSPMDPELRKALFTFLVRAGIYRDSDEGDFVMGLAQAEDDIRNGVDAAKDTVSEQMDKALQPRK